LLGSGLSSGDCSSCSKSGDSKESYSKTLTNPLPMIMVIEYAPSRIDPMAAKMRANRFCSTKTRIVEVTKIDIQPFCDG